MRRAITIAILLTLGACDGPDDITACEPLECADDGRCWASLDWPMQPEAITDDDLEQAIGVVLEPAGDCYSVINSDSHVCTVDVGCALLVGRPVGEVAMGQPCAPDGPWESSGFDGAGECLAVVDGVAVAVR